MKPLTGAQRKKNCNKGVENKLLGWGGGGGGSWRWDGGGVCLCVGWWLGSGFGGLNFIRENLTPSSDDSVPNYKHMFGPHRGPLTHL